MASQAELDRLCKLLGMLGSEFDGERAAAAAKVDETVKRLGLTWSKLIKADAAPLSGVFTIEQMRSAVEMGVEEGYERGFKAAVDQMKKPRQPPSAPVEKSWRDVVRHLKEQHAGQLSEWEYKFCASLLGQRRRELSDKQSEIVGRMWDDYCGDPEFFYD